MVGAELDTQVVGHPCGEAGIEVGEHEVVDTVEGAQRLRVEGADPAGAGESDAHVGSFG